jgi:glucosylceramidase
LLDEHGGPNHVGNLCSAPMLADTVHGRLMPQSSYFYIGHLARFVRPGAWRVLCAATKQVLEAAAFANPDGTLAVVVMNRGETAQRFVLVIGERQSAVDLPARAIVTLLA